MVTEPRDLDAFAQREFLEWFDHANLNTLESFRDCVPSTENVCIELWRIFARILTRSSSAFALKRQAITPSTTSANGAPLMTHE